MRNHAGPGRIGHKILNVLSGCFRLQNAIAPLAQNQLEKVVQNTTKKSSTMIIRIRVQKVTPQNQGES